MGLQVARNHAGDGDTVVMTEIDEAVVLRIRRESVRCKAERPVKIIKRHAHGMASVAHRKQVFRNIVRFREGGRILINFHEIDRIR